MSIPYHDMKKLRFNQEKISTALELGAKIATILGALTLIIAIWQINVSKRSSRESLAIQLVEKSLEREYIDSFSRLLLEAPKLQAWNKFKKEYAEFIERVNPERSGQSIKDRSGFWEVNRPILDEVNRRRQPEASASHQEFWRQFDKFVAEMKPSSNNRALPLDWKGVWNIHGDCLTQVREIIGKENSKADYRQFWSDYSYVLSILEHVATVYNKGLADEEIIADLYQKNIESFILIMDQLKEISDSQIPRTTIEKALTSMKGNANG